MKEILDFVIELPDLPGKGSYDLIEINVKFYLYQTEIKLQVEIENQIQIYTGSFKKESVKMLGDLDAKFKELDIKHGTKNIKASYSDTKDIMPSTFQEESGNIYGNIPEPSSS